MKIALCYICVTKGVKSADMAGRFCVAYRDNPPGVDHDLIIIGNGGPLSTGLGIIFQWIKAMVWPRENDDGWDISAYLDAARHICSEYDMMVCLGESAYSVKPGWLVPVVKAWEKLGPGMYGFFSSNSVCAHLNTSAFAISPYLLQSYPLEVRSKKARYEFEHGQRSFWRRVHQRGFPVRLVTWDGVYKPEEWRSPENIMWKGDQSNCLLRVNHTDNWEKASPQRKRSWSSNADRAFR